MEMILKKLYFSLMCMYLSALALYGQEHIHWGSTGDSQNGLTVTWQSTETAAQIKWGYTTSYEQGTFSGIRRIDYSGYLFDYNFPIVDTDTVIHYSIFSSSAWTSDRTF